MRSGAILRFSGIVGESSEVNCGIRWVKRKDLWTVSIGSLWQEQVSDSKCAVQVATGCHLYILIWGCVHDAKLMRNQWNQGQVLAALSLDMIWSKCTKICKYSIYVYILDLFNSIFVYQEICQCERLRSQHVQSSLPWSCCCSSLTSLATWNDGNSHGIGREMCSWSHEMRVQHDNTWQDLDQVHHGLKGKYSGKPNED